ncbi:MAG TPA: hypothetical protein VJI33_01015 [Candidatus Paceibacterota bacterium]
MKRKTHNSISRKAGSLIHSTSGYAQLSIPFLAILIAVGIMSYILLTSLAVWNADKRTSYEKIISQKSKSLVELESKISSINKKITSALATSRGFVETHNVKYIATKPIKTASRSNEMEL